MVANEPVMAAFTVQGSPVLWFIAGVLSAGTLVGQVQVNQGKRDPGWPFFEATTKVGRTAAIVFHASFVAVFFAVFVAALVQVKRNARGVTDTSTGRALRALLTARN